MRTLVIIPTYNEKDNIEKLVTQINSLRSPEGYNYNFNVLIIDDNSPDGTGDIIEKLKIGNDKLNVIHRSGKLGLGSAYKEGIGWALKNNYDAVFMMDADFSHDPKYLPEFLEKLKSNDLIIGSRYISGGGTVGWPLKRKIISRLGNLYAKIVTGMPINDNTSGFMCIRRNVLESIDIDDIKTEGYGFLIELKYKAVKKNFKVYEYPIVFVDRIAGKSKISRRIIFEAMVLVWLLRLKK